MHELEIMALQIAGEVFGATLEIVNHTEHDPGEHAILHFKSGAVAEVDRIDTGLVVQVMHRGVKMFGAVPFEGTAEATGEVITEGKTATQIAQKLCAVLAALLCSVLTR